jgi:hypothetical protein
MPDETWPRTPGATAASPADARLGDLDARLDRLAAAFEGLERRVAALEGHPPSHSELADRGPSGAPEPERVLVRPSADVWLDAAGALPLLGRTFLVVAGGYLLRVITDSGALARPTGVGAGLAYGVSWILLAHRAAGRGRAMSAAFHATTGVFLAFPLVFEATVKFGVFTPGTAAAVITVLALLTMAVAVRHALHIVAWATTAGAVGTSLGLMRLSGVYAPLAASLVAVGIATLWAGYIRGWTAMRWPVAAVANLTIVGMTMRVQAGRGLDSPGTVVATQLLLLSAYLGSFAARTLVLGRNVIPFEIVQSLGALLVGFGGAAIVTRSTGVGTTALAAAGLLTGAACYAIAFAFIERRLRLRENFLLYTSVALILVLAATALLLQPSGGAMAWAVFALGAVWLGRRFNRLTLSAHGAIYVVAAVAASGVLARAAAAFIGGLSAPASMNAGAALVLIAMAGSVFLRTPDPGAVQGIWTRLPRLVIAALLLFALMGETVGIVARLLAAKGVSPDPGAAATVRTAVLTTAIVLLAWGARTGRFRDLSVLVHPLLALAALKLLTEDFPQGRPSTLFVALALYGGALIAAARLRQRPPLAPRSS